MEEGAIVMRRSQVLGVRSQEEQTAHYVSLDRWLRLRQATFESQLKAIRATQHHHSVPKRPNQNNGWPKRQVIATRRIPTGNSLTATGIHSKSETAVTMHPTRCSRGKI